MNGGPILEDAVTPVIILNHILPGPPIVHKLFPLSNLHTERRVSP